MCEEKGYLHERDRIPVEKSKKLFRRRVKMSPTEAKAEVFWMAFKGLTKKEKKIFIEKLLKDKEFVEDLLDMAIIEKRRKEPSRPLEDYLAERKSRRN
jgi:hypothetical protein